MPLCRKSWMAWLRSIRILYDNIPPSSMLQTWKWEETHTCTQPIRTPWSFKRMFMPMAKTPAFDIFNTKELRTVASGSPPPFPSPLSLRNSVALAGLQVLRNVSLPMLFYLTQKEVEGPSRAASWIFRVRVGANPVSLVFRFVGGINQLMIVACLIMWPTILLFILIV